MERRALTLGLVLLHAVAGTPAAWGQAGSGAEVTLYGGTVKASGGIAIADPRGIYDITTEVEETGTGGGFLAGYNFNRVFGVELAIVAATNAHRANLVDRRPAIGGGSIETDLLLFLFGNGIVHLPVPGRLVPFASAGIGMLGTTGPATHLAFNYGVGAKLYLTRHVALRVGASRLGAALKDAIGQSVFTGNPADRCEDLDLERFVCFETPFTDRLRFTELTAGLTFRFR